MNVQLSKFVKGIVRLVAIPLGIYFGYLLYKGLTYFPVLNFGEPYNSLLCIGCMLVAAALLVLVSVPLVSLIIRFANAIESYFVKGNSIELISSSIGLIAGLLIAFLLQPIVIINIDWVKLIVMVVVYLVLGYIGIRFGRKYVGEFMINRFKLKPTESNTIILDTSAIIDGRIVEVVKSGFLPSNYVVPSFVLAELSKIADSEDLLKRNRGRRGLDMLKSLQKLLPVEVMEREYGDMDADAKVIKLAEELKASVVTVDNNLHKVAEVKKIKVLNLNELSNAIKPDSLPGEALTVKVVKAGNQKGQGVAFKEDGTMIVVENGEAYVGQTVDTVVTTSLQTNTGRIIFCRIQ